MAEAPAGTPSGGAARERYSRKAALGLFLGPALGVALWFAPLALDKTVKHTLAIVLFMIAYWVLEPIDHGITALVGCYLFWALNIVQFETAFSGFADNTPWFLFGGMLMGEAASKSGLARRIGFLVMSLMGTSYSRLLLSVIVMVNILQFMVPSGMAQLAILAPIVIGVIVVFDVGKGSNIGRGLFVILTYTCGLFNKMILSGGASILTVGLVKKLTGQEILWSQYFVAYLPATLITIVACWLTILWLYPPEKRELPGGRAYLKDALASMGQWTTPEKKTLAWLLLAIGLWSTDFLHHTNPAIIAMGIGLVLALPKIGVLTTADVRKLNFLLIIFMAGALSMGVVLVKTKALDVLTNAASGDVRPDAGTVEIGGRRIEHLTAAQAQSLGLAIVHQHPAVLPDLTVAENLILAVPRRFRIDEGRTSDWVTTQLSRVGCVVHPSARMGDVDIAQRQLIELAKALAIDPKILILDEPTAALTADLVDLLFEKIRAAAARGAAVIYISHRLQEVRQIAQRVTVMRDGEVKGSSPTDELSDEEMLRLIVGRTVTHTFPPKGRVAPATEGGLEVSGLSGSHFYDVDMTCRKGEIVGIAGITGNGQSEFIRALAGLVNAKGRVTLAGQDLRLGRPEAAYKAGITFLSSDRQKEGLMMGMSVRENAAITALPRFARFGVVSKQTEYRRVEEQRSNLSIRTASIDATVSSLSGGNQQKVIFARALLAEPSLVLAEDPTSGVDVGARAEIYRILREVADQGTPVVIVSSDVSEIEGLCDRVVVFSRGHLVGELAGNDVTEEKIGRVMVNATSHRRAEGAGRALASPGGQTLGARLRSFAAGDYAPSLVLAGLIVVLGLYAASTNARFLAPFNIEKLLLLSAALAFIGLGQMCAIFTGGIDLSVGPLTGLMVVISSFFFIDDVPAYAPALGLLAMFGVAISVGLVNGSLVRFGNFTAVAATLGVYIIIQGISVLLRPFPDGNINTDIIALVQTQIYGIPLAFIAAVALALVLEGALRHTRWGLSLRAVGSNEQAATRIGVRSSAAIVGAFVACCVLTVLGGIMVMAQLGIGDPNQGIEYTLASIAAVVLGGASLFGGRGAFVGVLFGSVLIQEINSATTFLGLSQAWQYWFIGLLTLGAVAIYSQARRAGAAT